MSVIDPSGFDLSGMSDIGAGSTPNFGSDPLGLFSSSPSTSSGQGTWGQQFFVDTQTGAIVSGAQASQLDPSAWQASLNALNASVNAPSPTGTGSSGGLFGLNATQVAQLAGVLGVTGGALTGAIARVAGNSPPRVPGLTAQEQSLLGTQAGLYSTYQRLLGQQLGVGEAVLPGLLARAGFMPNQQGGYTDLFANTINQATAGNLQNALSAQQGLQGAMSGDLTKLNPALTTYLDQQQQAFEQQARSQFGPGYQQSTPFQNANYYQQLARTNALANNQINYMNAYSNIGNAALTGATTQTAGTPSAITAAFGSGTQYPQATAAGSFPFENALSQNLLGYRSALNNYNANNSMLGGIGQAIGQATPLLFGSAPAGSPGLLSALG